MGTERYFLPFGVPLSEMKEESFPTPLQFDGNNETFQLLKSQMRDIKQQFEDKKKRELEEKRKKLDLPESDDLTPRSKMLYEWEADAEELVSGGINTINFVIMRAQEGRPVGTMIFLDKSARPVAYFFSKLWKALSDVGKIPKNIEMPNVRFINIGRGKNKAMKFEVKRTTKLFRENIVQNTPYIDKNLGSILIVDEAQLSGTSMKQAADFLFKQFGYKADGIGFLENLPMWYVKDYLKGVVKPRLFDSNFTDLENLHYSEFTLIKNIIRHIKRKSSERQKLVTAAVDGDRERYDGLVQSIPELTHFSPSQLVQFFDVVSRLDISEKSLVDYFDSEGGFLAKRETIKEFIQKNRYFRELLAELAKIAEPYIVNSESETTPIIE